MARTSPAAGLLLTGGASRRMGQDKAMLLLGALPLAERTARLLSSVADPVIEVGPGYTSLFCVREDPAGSGPLAALAAGAAALAAGAAALAAGAAPAGRNAPPAGAPPRPSLLVATDLPRLTGQLLEWLARHRAPGCVVPLDVDGRPQPVCARYSPEALAAAPGLVAAGHRSLMALLDRVTVTWLDPSEWAPAAGRTDALVDVDTPDDLVWLHSPASGPAHP